MLYLFITLIILFLLRRKLDTHALAAAGLVIYYFPIYFDGLAYLDQSASAYAYGKAPDPNLEISILIIFFALYCSSFVGRKKTVPATAKRIYSIDERSLCMILFPITALVAIIFIPQTAGIEGKAKYLALGFGGVLIQYFFSLTILISSLRAIKAKTRAKKAKYIVVSALLIFYSVLLLRTRSIAFFPVISAFVYVYYGRRLSPTIMGPKKIIFIAFCIAILLGKAIANYLYDSTTYNSVMAMMSSSLESFSVSSILNYVYASHFYKFYLYQIPLTLIPGTSELGLITNYHNDIIKAHIFPYADYGMGGNPIGEFWINLQYMGVLLYALILGAKCHLLDFLIKHTTGALRIFLIYIAILTLLYVNRNATFTDISFIRNYCVLFFGICLASALMKRNFLIGVPRASLSGKQAINRE